MRDGQATRIDYRNSEGDLFSMSIEYVNQIVLISLAELSRPEEPDAQQAPEAKIAGRFARMMGIG